MAINPQSFTLRDGNAITSKLASDSFSGVSGGNTAIQRYVGTLAGNASVNFTRAIVYKPQSAFTVTFNCTAVATDGTASGGTLTTVTLFVIITPGGTPIVTGPSGTVSSAILNGSLSGTVAFTAVYTPVPSDNSVTVTLSTTTGQQKPISYVISIETSYSSLL